MLLGHGSKRAVARRRNKIAVIPKSQKGWVFALDQLCLLISLTTPGNRQGDDGC